VRTHAPTVNVAPALVWIAFGVVVAAWGASYLFIRLSIESFTSMGLVASRFGLAAVLFAVIALARKEPFPRGKRAARLALIGLLMMTVSNGLTVFAQRTVPSGVAGVLHALSSVWLAALGGVPWLTGKSGEAASARVWIGVAAGVLGVAVISRPGSAPLEPIGTAALVVATMVFTVASLLQRRWLAAEEVGLFASLSIQMAAAAMAGAILATGTTGVLHSPLNDRSLLGLAWLTIVSSCCGFAAYAVVLRSWPPARAGSFAVINPMVSVLLGALVLGEPLTLRIALGMTIIASAVAWVQLQRRVTARCPRRSRDAVP
jgi:drug/metabolite transporter (DMT)-like permease